MGLGDGKLYIHQDARGNINLCSYPAWEGQEPVNMRHMRPLKIEPGTLNHSPRKTQEEFDKMLAFDKPDGVHPIPGERKTVKLTPRLVPNTVDEFNDMVKAAELKGIDPEAKYFPGIHRPLTIEEWEAECSRAFGMPYWPTTDEDVEKAMNHTPKITDPDKVNNGNNLKEE